MRAEEERSMLGAGLKLSDYDEDGMTSSILQLFLCSFFFPYHFSLSLFFLFFLRFHSEQLLNKNAKSINLKRESSIDLPLSFSIQESLPCLKFLSLHFFFDHRKPCHGERTKQCICDEFIE